MAKFVSNKKESIRLFENPVLEYFSHIHPATPVVVYLPVLLFFGWLGFRDTGFLGFWGYGAGLLLWTILEYSLHRWMFHTQFKGKLGQQFHFILHGVHHDYPRDDTRLVMPLLFSVPLAFLVYGLFQRVFGPGVCNWAFSGIVTGYVCYDTLHYLTHMPPFKNPLMRFLREYHLRHHYENGEKAFGVTSPLWDWAFGTLPTHMTQSGKALKQNKQARTRAKLQKSERSTASLSR